MKSFLIVTIFFVLCCYSNISSSAETNTEENAIYSLNREAKNLILEKKYSEALNSLMNSYNNNNYNSRTLFLIGISAGELGKNNLSIKFFSKALEKDPSSPRIRFNLALSYFKINKIEEAKKELIVAKDSKPADQNLARDIDALLAKIISENKNNTEDDINKINKNAEDLILKKEHKKALNLLSNTYKNNIYNSQTLFLIGVSARELGQYDLSIKFFNKIIKNEPNAYRVIFDLAISYIKNNQFKEAKKQLLIVKNSNPPADISKAIDNLLAQINGSEQSKNINPKVFYGLLTVGGMYDNNVNYGPTNNKIEIGQFIFDAQKTNKGGAANYSALLGYNKNFNNIFGAAGMVYGSLTDYVSSKNNGYDLMTGYVSQGINIFSKRSKLYIPAVYSGMWIDSSEFNRSAYLRIYGSSPSFTFKFTDNFYTDTTLNILEKRFQNLHDRNSSIHSLSNTFNLIASKSTMISLSGGGGNEKAELKPYSNNNYNGSVALYQGIYKDKLSTNISYSRSTSKYNDLDPIFNVKRKDNLSYIKGIISYNITSSIKLAISDTYSRNNSNISAFSYKKNQVSLTASYSF